MAKIVSCFGYLCCRSNRSSLEPALDEVKIQEEGSRQLSEQRQDSLNYVVYRVEEVEVVVVRLCL